MVLKWGIASCGRISNDFVVSLNNISKDEQKIVAVAARDKGRANDFAAQHRISTAYGSYEELAADNNIDVVYVCMLNTQHFAVSKLMLENGKHVLCEKPLCMNYKQSKELIEIAKSKGLFLMEAVWSRFFPVYEKLRKSLEDNVIGDILQVNINFGIAMKSDRVTQKDLGGSIVLDIGVYTLQFASLVFGRKTPYELVSLGHLNDDKVDESYSCVIKYPKGKTAASVVHGRVKMDNDAYIYGANGFIKIHQPFWCPTKITVNDKFYEFPLPENDEGIYNHVNSAGLHYEAKEVYKCIKEGAQESSIMSLEDSLLIAKQADTIRSQLGSVFDVDS